MEDKSQDCQGWWRALLARHGLYGPGHVLGAPELAELIGATLRYMRDRYAPKAFLRNLRTVHCGSKRLKEQLARFCLSGCCVFVILFMFFVFFWVMFCEGPVKLGIDFWSWFLNLIRQFVHWSFSWITFWFFDDIVLVLFQFRHLKKMAVEWKLDFTNIFGQSNICGITL